MTADKIRVELELIDGSFITRMSKAGQSVRTLERTVKSAAGAFGDATGATDKGGGALQKLASQADGARAKLEEIRKAADGTMMAWAGFGTADAAQPAPAGTIVGAAAVTGAGGGASVQITASPAQQDKKPQGFDQLVTEWGDTTARLREKGKGWLDGFSAQLTSLVMTGKAKFGELAKSILKDIVEMEIRATMSKLFSGELFNWLAKGISWLPNLIGGLFGTGGTGAAAGGAASGLHSGGIAGREATFSRLVPVGLFANAARFHGGGFPGLSPDEVPAILRKGEGVFTPEQMASLGGQVVNQTVNVNLTAAGGTPQQNSDLAERIGRQVQEQLRGMVAGEIRQQMRPGGMLAA